MGIMARCVDDAIGYWVQETADLHVHPNISVKVSALPGYSTQPFPNENIFPYVREMIEKMGPERCHWGTDITRLMGHGLTWKDTIEQFTVHMGLTEDAARRGHGQSLCRVLDWPIPVDAAGGLTTPMTAHSTAARRCSRRSARSSSSTSSPRRGPNGPRPGRRSPASAATAPPARATTT